MANEALVGNIGNSGAEIGSAVAKDTGLRVLKAELGAAGEAMKTGLVVGAFDLASGGSKVKAVWESIKWAALTRAGAAGLGMLLGAFVGVTVGIRSAITASGILQAGLDRLGATKVLTGQFTQFLGSVAAARARVAELYQFVAHSKFNLGEVVESSKALTIMSNGLLGGKKNLEMIGKVATNSGVSLSEIALAYGKLNQQTRNHEDISGTVAALKDMGVVSETSAAKLTMLSQSGASGAAIWSQIEDTFQGVADKTGDSAKSFEELQNQAAKAKTALAEVFGKNFLASETKSLEGTIDIMHGLTPAVGELGKMLSYVTGLIPFMKKQFSDVSKTDWFATAAKGAVQFALIFPGILAGYHALKGAGKFIGSTREVFKGGVESGVGGFRALGQTAMGAVNPMQAARNLAQSQMRLEKEASVLLTKQLELETAAKVQVALATELATKASAASAIGNLENATALKAESIAATNAAASLTVEASAVGIAQAKTALGGKLAGVGSVALTGMAQGAKQLGGHLASAGRWLFGMAGPTLVIAAAAAVAVYAWNKWSEAMERHKHITDMDADAIAGSAATASSIANLKTAEDRTKLLTRANDSLTAALKEQGEVLGRLAATDRERNSAAMKVAAKEADIKKVEAVDPDKLGMSAAAMERAQREAQARESIRQINLQGAMQRATPGGQLQMQVGIRDKMRERVRDFEAAREVEPKIVRVKESQKAAREHRDTASAEYSAAEATLQKERNKYGSKESYEKTITKGGHLGVTARVDLAKVEEIDQRITEVRTKRAKLEKAGSKAEVDLRKQLFDLQEKGSMADRLDREATVAHNAGNLELEKQKNDEAEDARIINEQSARNAEASSIQEIENIARAGKLRQVELDAAQEMLGITSETADQENEKLDIQRKAIQARVDLLKLTGPNIGEATEKLATAEKTKGVDSPEAAAARSDLQAIKDQHARDIAEGKGELDANAQQKREVLAAHQRNMEAWQAEIDAHKFMREAIMAAANGNFQKAAAATKAAQDVQDQATNRARFVELKKTMPDKEAGAMVRQEQTDREADRHARAQAYFTAESRRVKEGQLGRVGGGPKAWGTLGTVETGYGSIVSRSSETTDPNAYGSMAAHAADRGETTGNAAQKRTMEDQDFYRDQLAKNLQEMPNNVKEAQTLALEAAKTHISETLVPRDAGQVVSSDAAMGFGGGVYGGPPGLEGGGDPTIEIAKRTQDLTAKQNEILLRTQDILQALMGVK